MTFTIISGRLTKDPETGVSKNDKAWARFAVAVDRPAKNPETGKYDLTDFYNCRAFGNQADWISRCSKGDLVVVSGRMQQDKYTDDDGVEHKSWILMASDVVTAKKGKSSEDGDAKPAPKDKDNKKTPVLQPFDDDEDIPF